MDVARSVGYESDTAFSKAFKRVVGTNPGEYLKVFLKPKVMPESRTAISLGKRPCLPEDFWILRKIAEPLI